MSSVIDKLLSNDALHAAKLRVSSAITVNFRVVIGRYLSRCSFRRQQKNPTLSAYGKKSRIFEKYRFLGREKSGLHNGSQHHRAIEGAGHVGRHLYLTQTEGLTQLHVGDVALDAARNVLHSALNRHLVHNLVYNTAHADANGSTVELNGYLGLNYSVRRHSLEVQVAYSIREEVTLHVLHHGKHFLAVKVKLYQGAIGISSIKEYANVRHSGLNIYVTLYGRTVYHARNDTLCTKSVQLAGSGNLALCHFECKICHNLSFCLKLCFVWSSSDVGARSSPAGVVSHMPQGTCGPQGCHLC